MGVDHETGARVTTWIDNIILPLFRVMLKVFKTVEGFSPVDALSTGRSISWEQLGLAFAQIVLLMSGLLCALGVLIFNRRELASAQASQ